MPFSNTYAYEYQQAYSATAFAGPQLITGLTFNGFAPGQSFSGISVSVSLGYSKNPVGSLSSTFSKNDIAQTTFYGGFVSSNATSLTITASNPFLYNPALGDLSLQIGASSASRFGAFDVDASSTSGLFERVIQTGTFTTTAQPNYGIVTTFVSTPTVLGTPGPIAGAGLVPLLGLAGAYLFGRKRLAA